MSWIGLNAFKVSKFLILNHLETEKSLKFFKMALISLVTLFKYILKRSIRRRERQERSWETTSTKWSAKSRARCSRPSRTLFPSTGIKVCLMARAEFVSRKTRSSFWINIEYAIIYNYSVFRGQYNPILTFN